MTNEELRKLLNEPDKPAENTQQVSSIPVMTTVKVDSKPDNRSLREKELADTQEFIRNNRDYLSGTNQYLHDIGRNPAEAGMSRFDRKPDEVMVHGLDAKDDGILNKLNVGARDSIIGMGNDIVQGFKGSGYEMHKEAWEGQFIKDPEQRKKVLQDIAYITGQQMADLPVLVGIGALMSTVPVIGSGLTMGSYSALSDSLRQKRDKGSIDFGEVAKEGGKGFVAGQTFGLGKALGGGVVNLGAGLTGLGKAESSVVKKGLEGLSGLAGYVGGNEAMTQAQTRLEGRTPTAGDRWMNLVPSLVFDLSQTAGKKTYKAINGLEKKEGIADPSMKGVVPTDEIVKGQYDKIIDGHIEHAMSKGLDGDLAFTEMLTNIDKAQYSFKNDSIGEKRQSRIVRLLDNFETKSALIEDLGKTYWEKTGKKPMELNDDGTLNERGKMFAMTPEQLREHLSEKVNTSGDYNDIIRNYIEVKEIEQVRDYRFGKGSNKAQQNQLGVTRKGFLTSLDEPVKQIVKPDKIDAFADKTPHMTNNTKRILKESILTTKEQIINDAKNVDFATIANADSIFNNFKTASRVIKQLGDRAYRMLYEPAREMEAIYTQITKDKIKNIKELSRKLSKQQAHEVGVYLARMQNKNTVNGQKNIGEKLVARMIESGKIKADDVKSREQLTDAQRILADTILADNKAMWERSNLSRELRDLETVKGLDDYFTLIADSDGYIFNDRDLQPWLIDKKLKSQDVHSKTHVKKRLGISDGIKLDPAEVYIPYMLSMERVINYSPVAKKWIEFADALSPYQPKAAEFIRETGKYWAGEVADMTPMKRLIHEFNNNIVGSFLCASINTIITQPTALLNTVNEFGAIATAEGAKRVFERRIKNKKIDADYEGVESAVLRSASADITFGDIAEKAGRSGIANFPAKVIDWGLTPMKLIDYVCREITYETAFDHYSNKYKNADTAKFYADEAVNRTQGSGSRLDIAPVQRTAMGKLFLSFQTFAISNLNYLASEVIGQDPLVKNIRTFDNQESANAFAKERGLTVDKVDFGKNDTVYTAYDKQKLRSTTDTMLNVVRYAVFAGLTNTVFNALNQAFPHLGINAPLPQFVNRYWEDTKGYGFDDWLFGSDKYRENAGKPEKMKAVYNKYGKRELHPENNIQKIARIGYGQLAEASRPIPVMSGLMNRGSGSGGALISSVDRTFTDLKLAQESGKARDYISVANDASALAGNPLYQFTRYGIKYTREKEKAMIENMKTRAKYKSGYGNKYNSGYGNKYNSGYNKKY